MSTEGRADRRERITLILKSAETKATFHIGVLIVWEDETYCAIALEMSLRGYGSTHADAIQQLKGAIREQVIFCATEGDPGQVFVPADGGYWRRYAALAFEQIQHTTPRPKPMPKRMSCSVPARSPHATELSGA